MAKPTNVQDRFNMGANIGGWVAEDVLEAIFNADQSKTPLLSEMSRGKADQNYHEWLRDDYDAPNKDNAAIDGDDASRTALGVPDRVANYCQIYTKSYGVSGRAQAVKKLGGVKNALAYHRAKKTIEIKRDLEARIVSSDAAVAGSGSVPSEMGGLGVLIYTNAVHGVGGSTTAHTSGAPTTAPVPGTARAFTEDLVKEACQKAFDQVGSAPGAVYLSSAHKQKFSTFTGIAGIRKETTGRKQATIVGAADIYVSDFGDMEIVPHYMMKDATNVYGLDLDKFSVDFLRPFETFPLAKTGDSTSEETLADVTLVAKVEKSSWKIADLTPTGNAP